MRFVFLSRCDVCTPTREENVVIALGVGGLLGGWGWRGFCFVCLSILTRDAISHFGVEDMVGWGGMQFVFVFFPSSTRALEEDVVIRVSGLEGLGGKLGWPGFFVFLLS